MLKQQRLGKSSLWLAAACLVACGSLFAVAAPDDDGDAPERPRPRGQRDDRARPGQPGQGLAFFRVLRDLDLTEQQRQEVQAVLKQAREKRQAVMAEHKDELAKIDAQIRQLMEQRRKLMAGSPNPEQLAKQVNDLLTPEQQIEFKKALEAMRERARPGPADRGRNRAGRERPGPRPGNRQRPPREGPADE